MKCLVIGSNGLIGGRIIDFFRKKNIKTYGISRLKNKNIDIASLYGKLNYKKSLKNIDVLINCVGIDSNKAKFKSKKEVFEANSKIPLKLYKAALKNNVKLFIHISTFHVYKIKKFINEKSTLDRSNIYKKSKILGEKLLFKNFKQPTKIIIIRPCNLFGYPKSKVEIFHQTLINLIIKNAIKKKSIIINSNKNDYRMYSSIEYFCIYLNNLIKSNIIKSKNFLIINYSLGKKLNILKLVNVIKKILKKKYNIKLIIEKKYKKLKKGNNFFYSSLYKIKNLKNDIFFEKEINSLVKYYLNFKDFRK